MLSRSAAHDFEEAKTGRLAVLCSCSSWAVGSHAAACSLALCPVLSIDHTPPTTPLNAQLLKGIVQLSDAYLDVTEARYGHCT